MGGYVMEWDKVMIHEERDRIRWSCGRWLSFPISHLGLFHMI
jgi:hypothetical protein